MVPESGGMPVDAAGGGPTSGVLEADAHWRAVGDGEVFATGLGEWREAHFPGLATHFVA